MALDPCIVPQINPVAVLSPIIFSRKAHPAWLRTEAIRIRPFNTLNNYIRYATARAKRPFSSRASRGCLRGDTDISDDTGLSLLHDCSDGFTHATQFWNPQNIPYPVYKVELLQNSIINNYFAVDNRELALPPTHNPKELIPQEKYCPFVYVKTRRIGHTLSQITNSSTESLNSNLAISCAFDILLN